MREVRIRAVSNGYIVTDEDSMNNIRTIHLATHVFASFHDLFEWLQNNLRNNYDTQATGPIEVQR